MKLAALVALLLSVVGCSSGPCRDLIVYHQGVLWSYSDYHECGKQCCKKNAKECYCSKSCSCFGKHYVPVDPKDVPITAVDREPKLTVDKEPAEKKEQGH